MIQSTMGSARIKPDKNQMNAVISWSSTHWYSLILDIRTLDSLTLNSRIFPRGCLGSLAFDCGLNHTIGFLGCTTFRHGLSYATARSPACRLFVIVLLCFHSNGNQVHIKSSQTSITIHWFNHWKILTNTGSEYH